MYSKRDEEIDEEIKIHIYSERETDREERETYREKQIWAHQQLSAIQCEPEFSNPAAILSLL